jgi:hypothetical protein
MKRILQHLRSNAVGYLALFVALGGTSYAAFSLPAGSVGARQIKNHTITPVKLDGRFVNGNVRAWAIVGPNGKLIAGGGKPQSAETITPAVYAVSWGIKLRPGCATVATIDGNHSPPTERIPIPGNPSVPFTAGYAVADSFTTGSGRHHNETAVTTFNQFGRLAPLGFDVAVIC